MDTLIAQKMSQLTSDFYAHVSASFSATRQAPWQGWEQLLDVLCLQPEASLSVLDLACGNLRFERFLLERGVAPRVWACDSCDELVDTGMAVLRAQAPEVGVSYQHLDIAHTLFSGQPLADALDAPLCDLCVSFGFMHHVTLVQQRQQVLHALLDHTVVGGHVVVSFWQFALSERLMAKARPVPGGDAGDYLLGWQDEAGVARYCHSYAESEIDALAASCGPQTRELARFSADGREGRLNRYLVLAKTL